MALTSKQHVRPTIPTAKKEPDDKGVLKPKTARAETPKIKPAVRKPFGHLTHKAARPEPKPLVATMTGFHGLKFVLPPGLDPKGPLNVERNFDQRYRQYHDRLHRAGTIRGWLQLAELCRGKSRLVAALCLAFTGPVCGAFGYKAPGLQFFFKHHGSLPETTVGRVAATVWGGELAPEGRAQLHISDWVARDDPSKLGCGIGRSGMNHGLKVVAAAFNQMLLFLDHSYGKEDALIEIMNGDGESRGTKTQGPRFRVPLLSASVRSFIHSVKRPDQRQALIDSIVDIPVLPRWPISVARDGQEFDRRFNVLCDNFGWAGPEFVRRLTNELQRDHAGEQASRSSIRAIVDELRKKYRDHAADIKSRAGHDLTRITDLLATIYAAGCLAIQLKILPLTETDIRLSLLICQSDHALLR
jgi:hypothetical protein